MSSFSLLAVNALPESHKLELANLPGPTAGGYDNDLFTLIGGDQPVDHRAVADVLAPCSDGSVLAEAHAVAARQGHQLVASCFGGDIDGICEAAGVESKLAGELTERRTALFEQGQQIDVEFYNFTLSLDQIRRQVNDNAIGLVGLDWDFLLSEQAVTNTIDQHLLRRDDHRNRVMYPVVPIVGYSPESIIVRTYQHAFLNIPEVFFESARRAHNSGLVIVSSKPLEGIDRGRRALDKGVLLEEFGVSQLQGRDPAGWSPHLADGADPIADVLDAAEQYGLQHGVVHEFFDFFWNRCKSELPTGAFAQFSEALQVALVAEVSPADFTQFIYDLIEASDLDSDDHPASGRFTGLCIRVLTTFSGYDGPGQYNLCSLLRYELMEQRKIEGPIADDLPAYGSHRDFAVQELPFEKPDHNVAPDVELTNIPPPKPGEPELVTDLRKTLQWFENNFGEMLRETLVVALGKGTVRIGADDSDEVDVMVTPLHNLIGAIEGKFGFKIPRQLHDILIRNVSRGYKLLAEFDAEFESTGRLIEISMDYRRGAPEDGASPMVEREDVWIRHAQGLLLSIAEQFDRPSAFMGQIEYIRDIAPMMLIGRVHPLSMAGINNMLGHSDTLESESGGQKFRMAISQAKIYLEHLLETDSRLSHGAIWEAFDQVGNSEYKSRVRSLLTTALTAETSTDFKKAWREVLKVVAPDRSKGVSGAEALAKAFIGWSVARKQELEKKITD